MKGGPKQTSTVQQTNSYGWQQPPESQDVNAIRNWHPQIDPSIGYRYGQAENAIRDTYSNPLGAYDTAATRDAGLRSNIKGLNQEKNQAFREAYNGVNSQELGRLEDVAQLTSPRLVQTGSNQSGVTQQSSNLMGSIIGAGATLGAAAL